MNETRSDRIGDTLIIWGAVAALFLLLIGKL